MSFNIVAQLAVPLFLPSESSGTELGWRKVEADASSIPVCYINYVIAPLVVPTGQSEGLPHQKLGEVGRDLRREEI